jgi:GTPase
VSAAPEKKRTKKSASFRTGRIAILGRPNVGKSTLLNALVGQRIAIVSPHPQTTRDRISGILTEDTAQLVFVDTPGVHRARTKLGTRMNRLARDAAQGADVIVFMTDVGGRESSSSSAAASSAEAPAAPIEMSAEDRAILAEVPEGLPVILVVNKVDRLPQKEALFPILEGYAKVRNFAAIVPLSAKKVDGGVARLVSEAKALLSEGPKLFEEDELSDKPARFFVAELVREQILAKTRDEVPHGVAVTVERFDESPSIVKIALVIHVDREGHKKIVVGEKGQRIKSIGQDARKRVEELLGMHVHIELWVRVTPKWYESDAQMRDLGYGDES